jgi:hypothetical protein
MPYSLPNAGGLGEWRSFRIVDRTGFIIEFRGNDASLRK